MNDAEIEEELAELRTYGRPLDLQVDELIALLEELLTLRAKVRDEA